MNFKQIYQQVKKHIKSKPVSDEEAAKYINIALEEWHKLCYVCHKKLPTVKGVMIHIGKVHKQERRKLLRYLYLKSLN